MEMQMGKVKQLEQTIREDLEEDHHRIYDRKTHIVNALAYIRQSLNPYYQWNKSEKSILNKIVSDLTSLRDTDRQSVDILEKKIEDMDR